MEWNGMEWNGLGWAFSWLCTAPAHGECNEGGAVENAQKNLLRRFTAHAWGPWDELHRWTRQSFFFNANHHRIKNDHHTESVFEIVHSLFFTDKKHVFFTCASDWDVGVS